MLDLSVIVRISKQDVSLLNVLTQNKEQDRANNVVS